MWFFAICLFAFPIVIFGNEMCQLGPFHNCTNPLRKKFDDIDTAEKLLNVCPDFIKYIQCLGNYDKTCKDNAVVVLFSEEGEFESVQATIADICDAGSLLHAVLTPNLKCISYGLFEDNSKCYDDKKAASAAYGISDDASILGSEEDEHNPLNICFYRLYDITCFVEYLVNNCGGSLVKDAVIDILHGIFYLQTFCPSEAAVDFYKDVDKLEISDLQKGIMKDLLRKIIKKDI